MEGLGEYLMINTVGSCAVVVVSRNRRQEE